MRSAAVTRRYGVGIARRVVDDVAQVPQRRAGDGAQRVGAAVEEARHEFVAHDRFAPVPVTRAVVAGPLAFHRRDRVVVDPPATSAATNACCDDWPMNDGVEDVGHWPSRRFFSSQMVPKPKTCAISCRMTLRAARPSREAASMLASSKIMQPANGSCVPSRDVHRRRQAQDVGAARTVDRPDVDVDVHVLHRLVGDLRDAGYRARRR